MAIMEIATVEKAIEAAQKVKTAAEIALSEKIKHLPENLGKELLEGEIGNAVFEGIAGNDPDLQDAKKAFNKVKNICETLNKQELNEDKPEGSKIPEEKGENKKEGSEETENIEKKNAASSESYLYL